MWTDLAEHPISIILLFGLPILCYFIAKLAMLHLAKKTEVVDPCTQCGKELFACATCGCVFDSKSEARQCADWDRILKHPNHNNHHHDDQDI
jgi:hypothetical protein